MHSCGVVHGDIKGVNTLISVTGSHITPMICDFGSAHSAGIEVSHVDSTGTYRWMARELLRFGLYEDEDDNPCTSTFESDIWAYGMTVLVSPSKLYVSKGFPIERLFPPLLSRSFLRIRSLSLTSPLALRRSFISRMEDYLLIQDPLLRIRGSRSSFGS